VEHTEVRLPYLLDIALIVCITVVLVAVGLGDEPTERVGTVLVSVFVIGYAFSVPGYAFVAALFARSDAPWLSIRNSGPGSGELIDTRSRAVLSVVLSPIVTGSVVLLLDWSPFSLTPATVSSGLLLFVIACGSVAAIRRSSLPAEAQYRPALAIPVPTGDVLSAGRVAFVVIAAGSLLVAGGSIAHTAGTWEPGERFTELYLLTPGEDDPSANGYEPNGSLIVGVENREHQPMNYTVVVLVHRVAVENGEPTVLDRLDRTAFRVATLQHGDERQRRIDVSIQGARGPVRLTAFLYRGSAPRDVTAPGAYRTTHLWFDAPPGVTNASAR